MGGLGMGFLKTRMGYFQNGISEWGIFHSILYLALFEQ